MSEEFVLGAIRDLALLVAGGGLTLFGSWINGRRESRNRKEDRALQERDAVVARELQQVDAAAARERDAVAFLRTRLLEIYMRVREEQIASQSEKAEIVSSEVLEVENAAGLIPSEEIREPIVLALRALSGLGTPISYGYLDGTRIYFQAQILHSALEVLTASARGDSIPAAPLAELKRIGEATRDAWDEAIRDHEASNL